MYKIEKKYIIRRISKILINECPIKTGTYSAIPSPPSSCNN